MATAKPQAPEFEENVKITAEGPGITYDTTITAAEFGQILTYIGQQKERRKIMVKDVARKNRQK